MSSLTAGNTNYTLFNNCQPILGLTVTLQIFSDLVPNPSSSGFSIQLNATPPPGQPTNGMQFVFQVWNNQITGVIQYWDATPPQQEIVNIGVTIPGIKLSSNIIPAGYSLTIELQNDYGAFPLGPAITGAVFSVLDNSGNSHTTGLMPVTPALPIQSFQTVIAGVCCTFGTTFSSGSGVITYAVTEFPDDAGTIQQLCAQGNSNTCSGGWAYTLETSNATYFPMSSCCGSTLTQGFIA